MIPNMIDDLTIRNATADDAKVIAEFNIAMALESEGLELDPAVVRRGVEHAIAHPDQGRYFVAESDGRVVGQLMITCEWSDWRAGAFWWVQSVYVHPDFRSRGVFGRLYRHVESIARQDGDICGIRLYVDRDNRRAASTYEKLGLTATNYLMYEIDWSGLVKQEAHVRLDLPPLTRGD
jgi:GNAT superfamily N-acetyltransferase